ncbi:hypothetical protein GCM10020220_059740 [Nonomuraea rubra]
MRGPGAQPAALMRQADWVGPMPRKLARELCWWPDRSPYRKLCAASTFVQAKHMLEPVGVNLGRLPRRMRAG